MTSTAEILRALRDAIDGFKDCSQYKDEYLRKKHGDEEEIAALEAVYSKAQTDSHQDQSSSEFERLMR